MKVQLSAARIKEYLKYQVPVYVFDSIDSTNTVASRLAETGAVHGTSVFAHHQTKGRGRLGRSFASPSGTGIYMSVILKPDTDNPVQVTTAAAVAVCKALETVCDVSPEIKWVNDIYLENKKVCGILAEAISSHTTGKITDIILGIGLNLDAEALPPELSEIAGAVEGDFSTDHLAAEILNQLLDILQAGDFIDDYKSRSMVIGKTVSVYKGGYSPDSTGINAYVMDIGHNGGLMVLYSDGTRETLSSGEISIRL